MPRLSAAEFRRKGYDPQGQWCLLHGPEYELKLRLRDAMIERRVAPEDRGFAVDTIALARGAKAGAVIGAAQTASMMAAGRVVVVDWVDNLSSAEQAELARHLEAAPGALVILIEGPRGQRAEAYGERSGRLSRDLVKAVAEAGSVVECGALDREEAVAWVMQDAQALHASIKPAAAAFLVERVGTDLGRLSREVEKLALLALPKGEVSRQNIEDATVRTPEDNIFALGDVIGSGDADRALAVLRDLVQYQGVEPTTALAFMARQVRLIWQAKILLDAGWRAAAEIPAAAEPLLPEDAEIRQYLDGRRWLVNRLTGQARRYSWARLAYATRRLLATELSLKGMREGIGDHRIAIEMLVLDLCRVDR